MKLQETASEGEIKDKKCIHQSMIFPLKGEQRKLARGEAECGEVCVYVYMCTCCMRVCVREMRVCVGE